jgi:chromosome segregation ATPase
MAAGPDSRQLLELLKRAADELKNSQQETAAARADAESLARKLVRLEGDLQTERDRAAALQRSVDDFGTRTLPPVNREIALKTAVLERAPSVAPPIDERTNVTPGSPELVEQRLQALQEELGLVDDERRALKDQVKTLEAELAAAAERTSTLERSQGDAVAAQEHAEVRADAQVRGSAEARHAIDELQAGLEAEQRTSAEGRQAIDELQSALEAEQRASAEARLAIDELQRALEAEQRTSAELRGRLEAGAGELQRLVAELESGLEAEQRTSADLRSRLENWEARAAELELLLGQERNELAARDALATQNSQLDAELTGTTARLQALEAQLAEAVTANGTAQRALDDATARIAHLETEGTGLRSRRDELNVELGHVEKERNALRTRVAEADAVLAAARAEDQGRLDQALAAHRAELAATLARRAELETELAKEKERHQAQAQKVLDLKGRLRDLEVELEKSIGTARTANAEVQRAHDEQRVSLQRARDEQRAALAAQHQANEQGNATLLQNLAALQGQLEHATAEWRHVDRQYEQLHKEMLVLLDQRDEARRELELLRG